MKSICKYTGMQLTTASGFKKWGVVSQHPIFTVPLEELLEFAATEWSPEMPSVEKKLLMLAIGTNVELITWSKQNPAFAMPPLAVVESSISNLIKIAGWIDFARNSKKKPSCYPSFCINPETCHMGTFPDMLERIISNRNVDAKAEQREHRLICLEAHAKNLAARCRIGANKETALLRATAEWALLVTEEECKKEHVTEETKKDWIEMLQTSANKLKASRFSITDVHELRDFMLDFLPHGSVIAHDVIAHCNRLVDCNVFSDIDMDAFMSAKVLQTNVLDKLESSSAGATVISSVAPKRADFADSLSYARAHAAYILQRHVLEEEAASKAEAERSAKRRAAAGGNDESSI